MLKILKSQIVLVIAFAPLISLADSFDGGLEKAVDLTGLPKKTIPEMVAVIINAILLLFGTLFTVLLVWGGFRWMTSRGNAEQVKDARTTITNAFIGLAIVFISYAVVKFVLEQLLKQVNTGGGHTGS